MARVLELSKADMLHTMPSDTPRYADIAQKMGTVSGYSACRNYANIQLYPPHDVSDRDGTRYGVFCRASSCASTCKRVCCRWATADSRI
jgi:hypothetical protein